MRRRAGILGLAVALLASPGCDSREAEFGVDVFSADTIPAPVYMNLSGTLQLGLRADNFFTRTDSLVLMTPVSLVVQRGAGSALVFSLDTSQRLAMQPLGVPADSAERAGVVGRVLRITREGDERSVKLEVVKP
jgi:hypothetical protein